MLDWTTPLQLRMSSDSHGHPHQNGSHPLPNSGTNGTNGASSSEAQRAERLRWRHQQFSDSFERLGPDFTGDEWGQIATDLGWTIEEVQLYAYQYLAGLMDADNSYNDHRTNDGLSENGGLAALDGVTIPMNGASMDRWTEGERIIFDTLVATFRPQSIRQIDGLGYNHDWDKQIAARLPGKSARDVRQRYRGLYGSDDD